MAAVELLSDAAGNALAGADGAALGFGCPAPCCAPVADCSGLNFCAAYASTPYNPNPGVWTDPAVRNCCYGFAHRLRVETLISEWRVDRVDGANAGFESCAATLLAPVEIVINAPQCDPKFWPHSGGGAVLRLDWSGSVPGRGCAAYSISDQVVTRLAHRLVQQPMPDSQGTRTTALQGTDPGGQLRSAWCPVPARDVGGGAWQAISPWARDIVRALAPTYPSSSCTQGLFPPLVEHQYAGIYNSGFRVVNAAGGYPAEVTATNAWSVACGGAFTYDVSAHVVIRNGASGPVMRTIDERVRCAGSVALL